MALHPSCTSKLCGNIKMEKQRRQELKKKYKEEHLKSDPALQFLSEINRWIDQISYLSAVELDAWNDEELIQNIVYHVYNRFKKEGKAPKGTNPMDWERTILLKLPSGVQAVFATNLFEGDLSLNASYWNFFYQNNGAFALETLNGYGLMSNLKMAEVLEQCFGAYLKMHRSGEIEEAYGIPHRWDIDEEYFIQHNTKEFEELDAEYLAAGKRDFLEDLEQKKIKFIRKNKELFVTKE